VIELVFVLLGIGSTEFNVTVRDAASGKPVEGAFVVAREFTTVGQLHGSKTYCIRGDVAQVSGPRVEMRLPSPGTDSFRGARAIEALAYRPGYCLARTASGAAASYARYGPSYGAERPKPLDPAAETRLEMRRSTQSAEDRLLYLGDVARELVCGEPRWSDRGREGIDRLSSAMLAEAQPLARNRYERVLLERMQGVLAVVREMKPGKDEIHTAMALTAPRLAPAGFARDFIVGDPELRVTWDASRSMAIAAMPAPAAQSSAVMTTPPQGFRPGNAAVASSGGVINHGIVVQPRTTVTSGRLQPRIHCRHGAPSACDLNERDAQGATALHGFVGALKPEEVKVLLDAGADPSLASKPSDVTPIETLVERMARTQPDTGTAKDALEILEMLTAHPKVALPRKLRDDLAADPATWSSVQQSPGRKLLVDARPRLIALPVRAEEPGACAPLGPARYEGGAIPIRLRHP
jgi:hypothetical protein